MQVGRNKGYPSQKKFLPPKFWGIKILDFIILSILNPKAIKMRRPLVCNDLDDVITLWCDVKIVTPQGHVLFTAFGKLMFEYIF